MSNVEKSADRKIRRDASSPALSQGNPAGGSLDVICAGMYRACSTWQYTVAAHLVERYRGGTRLGYLGGEQYAGRRDQRKASGEAEGWTVFKSHDGDRFFAKALAERHALVLYAYRDVRDVVFSLMHKRGQEFEVILRQGMIQQILANDRFWTRGDRVLIQKYEDLVDDPSTGVMQIARHLGIAIDRAEADRIANEYSTESNRARIVSLQNSLKESGVDLNDASNLQICDPTTLLHWNHLRPARTETWRDLATPSQRRTLERLFGNWLEARGYPRDDLRPRADEMLGPVTLVSRIRERVDILRGWVSCRLYNTTLDYPAAARFAKRILKRGQAEKTGAVSWKDSGPHSRSTADHSGRESAAR